MEELAAFKRMVRTYYRKHGRHDLAWRQTTDPYQILVSEIMLQQTQVDRVRPKYDAFIKKYPTPTSLAKAPLGAVLSLWVGLGYNRRAKYLHEAAKAVVAQKNFPKTQATLMALPGVGTYTAGAVAAFAYNEPVVLIETNIRTVFIHHFFSDRTGVADAELLPLIAATVDNKNPRDWYYALMDYGVYLKREHGSNNAQSRHHTKQKPFVGSMREVRGALVRTLSTAKTPMTSAALETAVALPKAKVEAALDALVQEGLVQKREARFKLAT